MVEILEGDNLPILRGLAPGRFHLAYLDPPFNTGRVQARARVSSRADPDGPRVGFGGRRYTSTAGPTLSYEDRHPDFLAFLEPRLIEVWRCLDATGSLFVHLDYREVHHVKVRMDELFGRSRFINEIVWAYDYGGRSQSRWSPKHDTILWYARDPRRYTFRYDDIDRVPYMAPGLVGPLKAARGKTPTDTWWHTIVPTAGRERTGYPTQKPLGVIRRIVAVHSDPGDTVLDAFAGSGTTGEAAARLGRDAVLVDDNPVAIDIMARRLAFAEPRVVRAG